MSYNVNFPQATPPKTPLVQVHKVHYTTPGGAEKAATLSVTESLLVIVLTGEAEALKHYPVVRGTPNQRITPDLVDDHKQKEAWFYLFSLDEILNWAEHTIIPLADVADLSADTDSVPRLRLTVGDALHVFRFPLTSSARVQALEAALRGTPQT